jgi:hypothetical protein
MFAAADVRVAARNLPIALRHRAFWLRAIRSSCVSQARRSCRRLMRSRFTKQAPILASFVP